MSGRSRGGSGRAGLELLTDCSIDCKKFKKTADSVLKSITEVSADIAGLQAEWEDGFEGCVEKGEDFLKQVIKMDVSIGQVVEVLQGMEDFAAEIQPEDENSALLVDMFDQRLQGLNSPHVSSHPKLREFREAVSAAAAAAVQQDEPNEEEDMMVDESQELAMGQVTRSLTCPLTRQQFVTPVKSRQCGHTYSKEAVLNHIHISRTRGGARCPVGGCPETVSEDILERDVEMERLIRQAATKKRSRR